MEKLRVESCIERARKIDQELELIKSKCTGQVSEFLIDLWRQNVKRNEEISHERWQNNEKWLAKYEEDFIKQYENSNPFFKNGNTYIKTIHKINKSRTQL